MSKYNASELTTEGLRLASLAANGKTSFTITRVASTADDLSDADVKSMGQLPNEVQTGTLMDQLKSPDGNSAITGAEIRFDNMGLTDSYKVSAVGLFATESGEGKKEILYSVTKAIEPEFIPDFADKVLLQFGMTIYVIVGEVDQVSVHVDPTGLATKDYVDKAIEAHQVVLPASLMYSDKDAMVNALWTYEKDPVNANGSPYVAKETADTGYVRNNEDGTVNAGNWRFEPADKEHVITVNEAGTAEKANFDGGSLTVSKNPVVPMVMCTDKAEALAKSQADPTTIYLYP